MAKNPRNYSTCTRSTSVCIKPFPSYSEIVIPGCIDRSVIFSVIVTPSADGVSSPFIIVLIASSTCFVKYNRIIVSVITCSNFNPVVIVVER